MVERIVGMAERRPRVGLLVVDDEPANLAALEVVLAPLDQRIVLARSGREALRYLLHDDFAAILLDVRMPDMDGFETAELVRGRPATASTPILFVTAFPEAEQDLQRAYRIGAADVIFKPFVPEFLRTKVGVFVDLHQQQRSIRELLAQAQESSRAKSEFLNMAAHELRTPLAVIVGYLSMLHDGTFGDVTEDWSRVLQILSQKGEELNHIVDGLLTAARIEAGTVPGRVVDYDLREVARQAMRKATPQSELLGAELHLDLPEHPVFVQSDPTHLTRIVDNLVNNALAYSQGRPWVRLSVRADEPSETAGEPASAWLTVEDRGVGIPPEMRERIFDRFVRLEAPGQTLQPGTGLGLYISRELARRQGGELEVMQSEPGRGSTLALRLRLARYTLEPAEAEA
ncbi:MAG TPA: hybrid sensor histidine kinase/response regulator [Candidatus Dormibacteraeota bacterium]|nr:hybrid sensor histidine kinase/response regulator [Candidatus Dormibacteraeota bacterium]